MAKTRNGLVGSQSSKSSQRQFSTQRQSPSDEESKTAQGLYKQPLHLRRLSLTNSQQRMEEKENAYYRLTKDSLSTGKTLTELRTERKMDTFNDEKNKFGKKYEDNINTYGKLILI